MLAVGDGLLHGVIAWEADTEAFYYPLAAWASGQLQAGKFPLWAPQVFGGYPVFADGETGLASPLVLAALSLLTSETAFILLRLVHLAVAGLGTYALARAWRLRYLPATLAGLVFMLGSFLSAQIQHENIVRTAAWLPFALACLERALRSRDRARLRWAAGAAAALGMAGVGLHVQILLIDLGAVLGYGLIRAAGVGPVAGRGGRTRLRRLATAAWTTGLAISLGLALAMVQLLPLAELAGTAVRGRGITYPEAAAYSLSPFDLIEPLLPFAFRDATNRQWGLWTHWEASLYVGIAPLMLAAVALFTRRRADVRVWALVAVVGLVLAIGQYSPINLHFWLWRLPMLEGLRAPGRFTLLVVLALAMLAAHGLDTLQRRARQPASNRRRLTLHLGGLLGLPLVFVAGLLGVHVLLQAAPEDLLLSLAGRYLALPRDTYVLSPADVLAGARWTTDLANPRTAGAVTLLTGVALLLAAWQANTRAWVRRWHGWGALLVAVTAADLLVFGYAVHPRAPLAEIARPAPVVRAVADFVARDAADGRGPARVLAAPGFRQVAPNRFLTLGVEDARGYSSLEPVWHRDYRERVEMVDDELLDLWNIRYVVRPVRRTASATYEGVSYRPNVRLLSGPGTNSVGATEFRLPSEVGEVAELRLVAALSDAVDAPQGAPVAEVVLRGADGNVLGWKLLRAGQDVMDWGWDVAAVRPLFRHGPVEVAGTVAVDAPPPNDRRLLSYTRVVFEKPLGAQTVEVRSLLASGELAVFGAAVVDRQAGVHQLARHMRASYREVYRDADFVVYENQGAYARAFVVPAARVAPASGSSLEVLTRGAFHAESEVVLAAGTVLPEAVAAPVALSTPPSVRFHRHDPTAIDLEVASDAAGYLVLTDSYYPGWRATVDGEEHPLMRGNLLFRTLAVGPGTSRVELRFEPGSVRTGATVSLGALILLLALVLGPRPRLSPLSLPGPMPRRLPRAFGVDKLGSTEAALAVPPALLRNVQ